MNGGDLLDLFTSTSKYNSCNTGFEQSAYLRQLKRLFIRNMEMNRIEIDILNKRKGEKIAKSSPLCSSAGTLSWQFFFFCLNLLISYESDKTRIFHLSYSWLSLFIAFCNERMKWEKLDLHFAYTSSGQLNLNYLVHRMNRVKKKVWKRLNVYSSCQSIFAEKNHSIHIAAGWRSQK